MEVPKVFESEYRLCLILWEHEPIKSSELVQLCREQLGWKPTTTYTVIKKCVAKGAIERTEPNFLCRPLISKREVQNGEIGELVDRLFDGAADQLIAGLIDSKRLTKAEIDELKRMVEKLS